MNQNVILFVATNWPWRFYHCLCYNPSSMEVLREMNNLSSYRFLSIMGCKAHVLMEYWEHRLYCSKLNSEGLSSLFVSLLLFVWVFETVSCYVSQIILELLGLCLPQLSKGWNSQLCASTLGSDKFFNSWVCTGEESDYRG